LNLLKKQVKCPELDQNRTPDYDQGCGSDPDPDLFAGSGSESFPPDPDPVSGSCPSYIKLYNTIIYKLSFFKFSNFLTGEHFSTTKVSKCGKKYSGQEKCAFFKNRIRIRDPDPVLKF